MPDYYVWLDYYLSDAGKNVSSSEEKFFDKHMHSAMPSQDLVDSLQTDLEARVQQVATDKEVDYPGDEAVRQGRTVKTRKAK